MDWAYMGFTQAAGIRHFRFENRIELPRQRGVPRITDIQGRQQFVVGVDLDLIHRHGIPLQALPLLCRSVLERGGQIEAAMFTEDDMVRYVDEQAAAGAELLRKRRTHRVPTKRRGPDLPWATAWPPAK